MGDIFLSYAREDCGFAEKLARVLEGAGHDVWWDRHLGGGEEFSAEIEAALDKADIVLVAWSKGSVKSRWVRDEAAVGGDTGRLIPVSIDGSKPPMGFRQFHTLDLTDWKGEKRDGRSAELLGSVERRLKGKAKVAPIVAASQKPAGWRGRPVWVATALLAIVIAFGSIAFWNSRNPSRGPASRPTIALLPFTADRLTLSCARLLPKPANRSRIPCRKAGCRCD